MTALLHNRRREGREHLDVAVVGAGQAGLAAGYYLARHGLSFAILEGAPRLGEAWRRRWDSMMLFTPARYSALPELAFPGPPDRFPRKDEVVDYLEAYAQKFDLPIRLNSPVSSLEAEDGRYVLHSRHTAYRASQVVVATGAYQRPYTPPIADDLADEVFQVHSAGYRNPDQLAAGPALVVGGANSGQQIAEELAATRTVSLSTGSWVPSIPRRIAGRDIFWWADTLGLMRWPTVDSRLGRLASARDLTPETSLRRLRRKHGVDMLPRAVKADERTVTFSDGRAVEVSNVVWATGWRPGFGWIDLPVFDERGYPRQRRGVTTVPGLYFLGLSWMHTRGSGLIGWVKHDAEHVVDMIVAAVRR